MLLFRISLKLICSVGISIALIIGVFAVFSIHSQSHAILTEIEHNNNQLAETVKSSTRFDMLLNNREHLQRIIKTIGSQPSILDVRVYNKDGVVIYSSDSSQIGTTVDQQAEACFNCHASNEPLSALPISDRTRIFQTETERVMGTIYPINNDPSCSTAACHAHDESQTVLGVLDITESLADADRIILQSKWKMLLFTLVTILMISLILWFFVRKWIDRPVRELMEATKQVASGNLNVTVRPASEDELGTLARSFNTMTQKLSEARLQLFQSDKMASMGRLAAGVAHEINNPLTGILTYSSFLLKRTRNQPDIHKDLEVIVHETKRSRDIVKGLLDFARQSVPKKISATIPPIVERAVAVLENQLSLNKVQLQTSFEIPHPQAFVDVNQLQQVFINLIVNAIHALPEHGGHIDVGVKRISLAPFGLKQIKSAQCPKGHNLLDQHIKVNGMPCIQVGARIKNQKTIIHLDPVYGKQRHHFGVNIQEGEIWESFCPVCDVPLDIAPGRCPECGGPIFAIDTGDMGEVRACSKKGCGWQFWQHVEAEGDKHYVEIRVQDNGCGIPAGVLDKIFEPFFTTKGQQGTGLGLAVIWGIVDNHDGRISVRSKEGEGTTFTVRLPALEESNSPSSEEGESRGSRRLGNGKE